MLLWSFPLILSFCAALAVPLAAFAQDTPAPADDPKARRIVEEADRIRFPAEGFQVDVAIVTTGRDKAPDERRYRVLSKGNENTVVMITEPASEKGQIMLMKSHELWIFLPSVSQPVRLSLSQRLTGQVANGDLARANFAGDYNPRVLRTETIDGESYNVLELQAVDRSVTYQRVLYWVHESTSAPRKAEFYSASNRLLKTCVYEKFETVLGKLRPTRLVMDDAPRSSRQALHQGLPEETRMTAAHLAYLAPAAR
jgi:outer membrane lipoprotein-sorting protein